MEKFKIGDIVGRKSYNKDIIFEIYKIENINNKEIAILRGIIERIEVDSDLDDLEILSQQEVEKKYQQVEEKINKKFNVEKRNALSIKKGRVLHLDGDRKYSQKSYRFYKKLGLNAIVRNIEEKKQKYIVGYLIKKYNPDVLVITGHDSLLKKTKNLNNLDNYKNSKYFIETVKEARKHSPLDKLAIFAGACQSFYEGLIFAGANFASSPARILIDFTDPLIVADQIASTSRKKYITIEDIEKNLKNGKRGVNGIGTYGKMRK